VAKVQEKNFPWVVRNVEYVAEMIHLAPDVDRAIFEANGGRLIIPYTTYSQHRWIASNGSGSMSMAFSSPYKSLKTLVAIFRKDEDNYNNKSTYQQETIQSVTAAGISLPLTVF
jgi:hypothetical protein